MNRAESVRDTLKRPLPITQGAWQITLGSSDPDDAVKERDGDVIAEIGVWTRDEEGALVDVKTQEVPIVQGAGEPTASRLVACLEGWVKALPALIEQASRVDPAFMPIDIICPPALREQGVAYQGLDLYRPFGVLEWCEEGRTRTPQS